MYDFLSGAVAFGFLISGLFFFQFWKRTQDGFFVAFALAFALLGLGQAAQTLANLSNEERGSIYLFRLAAFALILIAIARKNKASA